MNLLREYIRENMLLEQEAALLEEGIVDKAMSWIRKKGATGKENFKQFLVAMKQELSETRTGLSLLGKIAAGQRLEPRDVDFLRQQLKDVVSGTFLLSLFLIPGGSILTTALLKVAKKLGVDLAPTAFRKNALNEAAMKPVDLPAGVNVQIKPGSNNSMKFLYVDDNSQQLKKKDGAAIYGMVAVLPSTVMGTQRSKCGGAYEVMWAGAADGWGPLLYDVAMEWTTQNGGGLISDRGHVSPEARSVWDYYMSNRPDVQVHQLDDLENTLTPIDDDNCNQKIASYDNRGMYPENVDWQESPLSKRYTKQPATINTLRAAGRLIEP